jgi:FixJ family two-component response regulator
MNLTSKEIAPMMNISFRGVELHRYRRKKLVLVQDDNLSKFLLSYKNRLILQITHFLGFF